MWIVFAIITVLVWGISETIFKKSSSDTENNILELLAYNGILLGVFALVYFLVLYFCFGKTYDIMSVVYYMPIVLIYNMSMWVYYKAMSVIKISLVSPIANSSCLITVMLCVVVLKQYVSLPQAIAIALIIGSIFVLSIKKEEAAIDTQKIYKTSAYIIGIACSLGYFFLDGFASFLDEYVLEDFFLNRENELLISFSIVYCVIGLICHVVMRVRDKKIRLEMDRYKLVGSIFETVGEYTYIYAFSYGNASVVSPFVASYTIVTLVLSRIFLKEKLKGYQYFLVLLILLGVIILSLE